MTSSPYIAAIAIATTSMAIAPRYYESPEGTFDASVEASYRPWARTFGTPTADNLNYFQEANTASVIILHHFYAAERYRVNVGAVGQINFNDLDISSVMENIRYINCYVSSDNRTVCSVTLNTYSPPAILAMAINEGHGKAIAGIFNNNIITAPNGSNLTVPAGVVFQDRQIIIASQE